MKTQPFNSKIYMIRYYNIEFYLYVKAENEALKVETLGKHIEGGLRIGLRGISEWCTHQRIKCFTKFKYRKDYPIKANIWNLYSYCRFKLQRG